MIPWKEYRGPQSPFFPNLESCSASQKDSYAYLWTQQLIKLSTKLDPF